MPESFEKQEDCHQTEVFNEGTAWKVVYVVSNLYKIVIIFYLAMLLKKWYLISKIRWYYYIVTYIHRD